VSVSISHTEGRALCAASAAGPAGGRRRMVGIDLGRVEPRSRAFLDTFFTDAERGWVLEAADRRGRDLRANLLWCAKEAVLKVLGLGLTVDTRHLCCVPVPGDPDPAEWPLAPADGAWRPFAAACGRAIAPGGPTMRGIWRAFPGFVAALAAHG
jgi:phosphopantetheinyl transferase